MDAGFRAFRDDSAQDVWLIGTTESTTGYASQLLRVEKLGGVGVPRFQGGRLAELLRAQKIRFNVQLSQDAFDQHLRKMGPQRDPVDPLSIIQTHLTVLDDEAVPQAAAGALGAILSMQGESGNSIFPAASVHAISIASEVRARARFAPLMTRLSSDRGRSAAEIERELKEMSFRGDLVFQSSQELVGGLFMLDAYIGPLLSTMSPAIWGFTVTRSFGPLVYSLGSTLSGLRQGAPAEPLQMLGSLQATESLHYPRLSERSTGDALSWWVTYLNKIVATVTDPTCFTDGPKRDYRPEKQMQGLMGIEQLFRKVHSIQTGYRDAIARRTLFFTVLDALEHFLGQKLEKLCDLQYAQETIAMLRHTMTDDAAVLLLYGPERGVRALEALQDGFFRARQSGRCTIPVGNNRPLALATASSRYIRLLRNGTHGFMGSSRKDEKLVETLFAEHNGSIPHDLPLLANLYLMRLMVEPETLRRNLLRQSTRRC